MKKFLLLLFAGLTAGFINGLFGTGGALVLIGALVYLSFPTQKALATSSVCILFLSAVSFLLYLKNGMLLMSFLPEYAKSILLPSLLGGAFGSLCLSKISTDFLKKIFFIITVIGGIGTVLK